MDHHASDLYVKATDAARAIVQAWQREDRSRRVSMFAGADGPWYEIPFAYDPFWEAKKG